jgi:FtsH-binding integral membrane protein
MAPRDEPDEDIIIEHPNRDKAGSKATKLIVIVLLLVSVALLVIISIGGWEKLAGARPLQIAYIVLFLVLAFFVGRWSRGVLPVASALAIILLIFAAVSAPGWYDRGSSGFADTTLPAELLGLLCVILIPVQILLIAFAMRGFQQAWNVEVERPRGERRDHDDRGSGTGAVAAPA